VIARKTFSGANLFRLAALLEIPTHTLNQDQDVVVAARDAERWAG
jgi:hypothetical protein